MKKNYKFINMKTNKLFIAMATLVILVASITLVYASEEEIFMQAEEIIAQNISCDALNETQLEILGDYYMEQMHPGELHEIMDERMGGEGSESLRRVHINMGLSFYCRDSNYFSRGNMMMGMMGYRGMIGNSYYGSKNTLLGIFGMFIAFLAIVILVLFIILIIKQLQKND